MLVLVNRMYGMSCGSVQTKGYFFCETPLCSFFSLILYYIANTTKCDQTKTKINMTEKWTSEDGKN